jgi:hypothetical protein
VEHCVAGSAERNERFCAMKLALIAIFLFLIITVGIYSASPYRRIQMIAAFRRDRRAAAQHFLLLILGYAVPIYLLLFVDRCPQWTALE